MKIPLSHSGAKDVFLTGPDKPRSRETNITSRLSPVSLMILLGLALLTNACTTRRGTRQDAGGKLGKISDALVASAAGRIEFFSVQESSEYYIPLSPARLRSGYTCKLTLDAMVYEPKSLDLAQAIIDTQSVQAPGELGEVRNGVIFYTKQGDVMSEIYFARKGDLASIDGLLVHLRGPLRDKVKSLATLCER